MRWYSPLRTDGVWVTGQAAHQVLGPTAAYFGVGVKGFTKEQVDAVSKILANARAKLGPLLQEPGAVPPKVLAALLKGVPDLEDRLAQEYLAGVVAASRSPDPQDDLAAAYVKLIARLTPPQLQFHYGLYRAFWEAGQAVAAADAPGPGRPPLRCFIPQSNLERLFGDEDSPFPVMLDALLAGLDQEGLIGPDYGFARHPSPQSQGGLAERLGLVATASVRGWQLFCYAHGRAEAIPETLLRPGPARWRFPGVVFFPDALPL